jgi:hypothetical protein
MIGIADAYDAVSAAVEAGLLPYPDALEVEYLDLPTPAADTLRRLRQAGVPQETLGCPIVALREARVRLLAGGRFDIADDGDEEAEDVLLVLVRNLYEEALDVAAFVLDRPIAIYTLGGRAVCLGEHLLRNPASTFARPLRVFRDALAWLRGGADGIVVVGGQRFWRCVIDLDLAIEAEDWKHGRELEQLVRPQRVTRVLVRRAAA